MSVNGTIQNRLAQDIASVAGNAGSRIREAGDTSRASVDVNFSRQLTANRFAEKREDKQRRQILEDQARAREQQLADRADAEQLATQKFAVGKLFDIAMNDSSGDGWTRYMELNTSGSLRPDVQQLSDLLADGQGGLSLEARKFEHQQDKDFDALSLKEQELALKTDRYTTDREIRNAELLLKKKKHRLDKMKLFREEKHAMANRRSMIDFVRDTPDIETQRERDSFVLRLEEAAPDEIIKVWDEIMDRAAKRLDRASREHNARIAARGQMGPITTDASKLELSSAEKLLTQALGSAFNDEFFDKGERDLMIESMAQKLNFYSRQMRKDQADPEVVQKALADVVPGFDKGSFLGFFDDPEFTILPPGVTEEDIEATMRENNMSRAEVLKAIRLK